jgi:hypothetical protein
MLSDSPPTPPLPRRPRDRRTLAAAVALAVVLTVVVASVIEFASILPFSNHVICTGVTRLGNVSAWYPYAFVAAPYNGSVSGKLVIWSNYTIGGTWRNLTSTFRPTAASGDVILGDASGGNWTIYSAANMSEAGGGKSSPCSAPFLATLGPPNGPASDSFGGVLVASGLHNDTGLPSTFNASSHCTAFGAPPNCAVSSAFDLNFTRSIGQVNTCGNANDATMDVKGQQMEAYVPFFSNETNYMVPIGPSTESGMIGWFNYTFPADGGVWQYQYVPGISTSESGLVFSYASCPD